MLLSTVHILTTKHQKIQTNAESRTSGNELMEYFERINNFDYGAHMRLNAWVNQIESCKPPPLRPRENLLSKRI